MMALPTSDTLMIDPLLDDTLRLLDCLSDWPSVLDTARDADEHEPADFTA